VILVVLEDQTVDPPAVYSRCTAPRLEMENHSGTADKCFVAEKATDVFGTV
jgi:hypothetical protein